MPCCKQNGVAIFHMMFISVDGKYKKYAATQLPSYLSLWRHICYEFCHILWNLRDKQWFLICK